MTITSPPPPPPPWLPPLRSLPPLPPPQPLLPVGYRFRPTDYGLLNHYLRPKMTDSFEVVSYPNIIEADIYGDHPSKIFGLVGVEGEEDEEEEGIHHYFFTSLKKTTEKGSRISRRVGNFGTWKAENCKEILMPKTKILIGYNKYFKYVPDKRKDKREVEVEWLMHEYSLLENQEIVICRITKNVNKKALANYNKKGGVKKRALEPFQESNIDTAMQVQEPESKRACLEHPSMNQTTIASMDDHELQLQQPSSSNDLRNVSKSGTEPIKNTLKDNYGDYSEPAYDLVDVDKFFDEQQWIHEGGNGLFENPSWDLVDIQKLFDGISWEEEEQHIHGSESY